MITKLIIAYSWWFFGLIVLLALLYAALLYVRNKRSKINGLWVYVLFGLRFLSISLIGFLLLSPYILSKIKHTQKPIIILGIDNSSSMARYTDSTYLRTKFLSELDSISTNLSTLYDVERYSFGEEIVYNGQLSFKDESSDYASFLAHLRDNYGGFNVGALIMAGDGVYNTGIDPIFMSSGLDFPIYTIALGDTNLKAQIRIADIRYNSIAYLDDLIPLEITLAAEKLKGSSIKLRLKGFGTTDIQETISIEDDVFVDEITYMLEAGKTGKQRISISIESTDNNGKQYVEYESVFVDVLDTRQKILLLANGPHPDIGAIRSALQQSARYDLDVAYANHAPSNLRDYDLVILHQLPSKKYRIPIFLNQLRDSELAVLYCIGPENSLPATNVAMSGLNMQVNSTTYGAARFSYNPEFTAFKLDSELSSQLENLPPLKVPLGNHISANGMAFIAFQRINNMNTSFPLISFYNGVNHKEGIILGEGLWMWRLHNFLQNGQHKAFDQLISKSIQYLLSRKDKRFFRVSSEGTYNSHQRVNLSAELYNPTYESIGDADIAFSLINEDGDHFNYQMTPAGTNYSLDLAYLRPGLYNYEASTTYGNKNHMVRGEFVVRFSSLETKQSEADHALLHRMATQNGGQLIYPESISSIPSILKQDEKIRNLVYYESLFSGLHTSYLVLTLILSFLCLEWFLRKYLGDY